MTFAVPQPARRLTALLAAADSGLAIAVRRAIDLTGPLERGLAAGSRLAGLGREGWWATGASLTAARPGEQPALPAVSVPPPAPTPTSAGARDNWRQGLNLALAVAQALTPSFAYATGLGANIEELSDRTLTWITPADYAFGIWGFIYPASIAYGVYQALPAQRGSELLRRIGPFTASAFLANALWPLAFELERYWLSVAIISWTLGSLAGALAVLIRHGKPLKTAERLLVRLPVSVFAAWLTVASIVNAALALQAANVRLGLLSERGWGVAMLAAAGGIGALVTLASRGNAGYALTIVWALVGVAVAKAGQSVSVAATAGGMAVLVALALLRARGRRAAGANDGLTFVTSGG